MNERMSHLPQDLERLSAAEKFELLDALWESLESDLPALSAEQRGELDYREGRYRENPAGVLPWEQIKTDLLKKTVTLPVVWLPGAQAELMEALEH
jgi:putative addiction module component (TIGR02574 family)